MFLRSVLVSLLTVVTVFCCTPVFAGKVELTTYYPAPFGEYQNINSTQDSHFATTSGMVGIGTTAPVFLLDVAGRMRVRSGRAPGGNETAGIWFTNVANSVNQAFVGMADDNVVGFWGNGAGWSFGMNVVSGNVGIGTVAPAAKLDIAGEIKLSGSGLACSPDTEGSMRYNNGTKAIQFCNGNAWVSAGGSGSIYCDFKGTWSYDDDGTANDFAITCRDNIVTGWCGKTPVGRGFHAGNYACEG